MKITGSFFHRLAGFAILSIFIISQFACDGEGYLSSDEPKQDEVGPAILEIYTESKYAVYPPGRILNLKVNQSGDAEYDYYPPQTSGMSPSIQRRRLRLKDDEFSELKSLIQNLDQEVNLKAAYEPTVPILDASIETTVMANNKGKPVKIVLKENHSNLILERKDKIYPKSLIEILIFTRDLIRPLLSN